MRRIAHRQQMVGNKSQPVQTRRLLRFEQAHFAFDTQHIDVRLAVVERRHGTVDQAVVGVGKHIGQETLRHVGNGIALCDNGQDNGTFHLFRSREGERELLLFVCFFCHDLSVFI